VIPIVIATKPDGRSFGNLFFASEAPRKGVSSLSPDNVFAAEVSACCNAEQASAGRALNQGGGLSHPVGCHTWRATGITIYLENDGRLGTFARDAKDAHAWTAKGASFVALASTALIAQKFREVVADLQPGQT
jgi:hypothetical protein